MLPGIGQSSWIELMLMIRPPPPCFTICLAASWVPKKALRRLMPSTFSYCASVVSSTEVRGSTPAVLTSTARRAEPLADIVVDADDLVAERGHLLLEGLRRLRVGDVVDDEAGSLTGKFEHHGQCESAGTAGD